MPLVGGDKMRVNLASVSFAAAVFGLVLIPASLSATPITGSFDIGGSSATVTALSLSFSCNSAITNAPCPAPANYGNFAVTGGTGSFAPYVTEGGYIHAINNTSEPLNTSFSLPNFIMFSSSAGNPVLPPDIALDLSFIFLGVDGQAQCAAAPAPGQTCTPAIPALVSSANPSGLSAFNLQNTQTGSSASFSVEGTARRISTGETSNFTGVFTAQFNVPYQTVLQELARGSITNSYSATFQATVVPEPQTTALVLGGLLVLLGRAGMRRLNRRS